MNMDRKSIAAIAVCVLFYLGYEAFLSKKYPDRFKRPTTAQVTEVQGTAPISGQPEAPATLGTASPAGTVPAAGTPVVQALSEADLKLENTSSVYRFDQKIGGIRSIILKDFKNDANDALMEIVDQRFAVFGTAGTEAEIQDFAAERLDDRRLRFSHQEGAWLISHEYQIDPAGFGLNVVFTWKNTSDRAQELTTRMIMQENVRLAVASKGFMPGMPTGHPSLVASTTGEATWYDAQEHCKDEKVEQVASGTDHAIDFVGFDKHYFLKVLLPQSPKLSYSIQKKALNSDGTCRFAIMTSADQGTIAANQSVSLHSKGWFGPKVTKAMERYDAKLKGAVDLGFFAKISGALLIALHFVESLVGNWGLAIILFTLLLKVLFYPLTRAAAISMHKMKKLQPEMNRLKERYADDTKKQQAELMKFMSTHKVNPMKGCLPILPQIPVFFAFYRVLSASIELRNAPFYGWIQDLSVHDPFYITPILLGIAMFMQQKLTPTTGMDKTQERIMMMLPIIFAVMMLSLPAGMVLYVLTNTIVSIAQQQWLNKRLG